MFNISIYQNLKTGFFSGNCKTLIKVSAASDFLNKLDEEKHALSRVTLNTTPQFGIQSDVGQIKTQENALQVLCQEILKNTNEVIWQVHIKFSPS